MTAEAESDAVKYIELGEPDLVAAARFRKRCFQREVAEWQKWKRAYNAKPFYKKLFDKGTSARHGPTTVGWAEASVESHIALLRRSKSELSRALWAMAFTIEPKPVHSHKP